MPSWQSLCQPVVVRACRVACRIWAAASHHPRGCQQWRFALGALCPVRCDGSSPVSACIVLYPTNHFVCCQRRCRCRMMPIMWCVVCAHEFFMCMAACAALGTMPNQPWCTLSLRVPLPRESPPFGALCGSRRMVLRSRAAAEPVDAPFDCIGAHTPPPRGYHGSARHVLHMDHVALTP